MKANMPSRNAGILAGARDVQLHNVQMNVVGGGLSIHNHNHSCSDAEILEALRLLPNPSGCSWDPSRTCFPGTRTVHIKNITSWIDKKIGQELVPNTLVVAAAAGSGKSALAHTICQLMHEQGRLLASFFFFFDQMNRESAAKNLMAALIRALCAWLPPPQFVNSNSSLSLSALYYHQIEPLW
ncbi:hypothetical protein FA15DRAFT_703138 [Coprinopsis marcescibilis]|uniref:Nephrocystin 3-like N-terminal domain-containing protein n=1 Tax=Coprinopsis marcescibilis TaxID=230819 RepID=A0A5C3KZR8_COPMA|nr:hypothetical protein FA15DRAFT_703138 [Coprinopsis marcescibilis]